MYRWVMIVGLVLAGPVWAGCFSSVTTEGLTSVVVSKVYDGDTVKLTDGRKIRILNINTPELGRDGGVDDAFARHATEHTRKWLNAREKIYLLFDVERKDRYGRWLAHVLDSTGESLAESLLRQGLASPLAVPPNLAQAECYFALAKQPKRENIGVWAATPFVEVTQLSRPGFQRVRGVVSKISQTRAGDYWLELQGQLAIQVRKQDLVYFNDFPSGFEVASKIEVEGWVVDRSGSSELMRKGFAPWKLQVRTPYALTVINN